MLGRGCWVLQCRVFSRCFCAEKVEELRASLTGTLDIWLEI
jgi:hypothetical protein